MTHAPLLVALELPEPRWQAAKRRAVRTDLVVDVEACGGALLSWRGR
jgi:hypothetical protein